MRRALLWTAVGAGAVALVFVVVLPLALGNVVYTSALACMGDERPHPDAADEVYALELRAADEVSVPRPAGPHTLLLEAFGTQIVRGGEARASPGYQTHGCGGGDETIRPVGDGTLQVTVWRYGAGA